MEYLTCAGSANIFKDGDIIIKKYYDLVGNKARIKKDIFETLRSIDHPCFIHLIDMECDSEKVLSYRYYYVLNTVRDIVYKSSDYTINNIRKLESLINILSDLRIIIDDTNPGNILFQEDNAVLIDPDYYYFDRNLSFSDAKSINNKKLVEYFFRTFNKSRYVNHQKVRKLFDFNVDYGTDIAYELSHRLSKKKPIDYLR